jgi:hypothetical protein
MLTNIYLVYKDKSLFSVFLAVMQILEIHYPNVTIWQHLWEWMKSFEFELTSQTLAGLTTLFELATSNWALFQAHPLYKAIMQLCDLVMIGLLTPGKFIPEVLSVFDSLKIKFEAARSDTSSFLPACIKNVSSMLSSLKIYCETGDVVQSFCFKTPLQKIYDILGDLSNEYVSALQGDITSHVGNDYVTNCDRGLQDIESLVPLLRFGDDKTAGWAQLRIKAMSNEIYTRKCGEEHRIQPYAFACIGGSGVGKSNVAVAMIETLLNANGIYSKMATINLADKFLSTVYSDTTGYVVDDPDFFAADATKPTKGMTFAELVFRALNNAEWILEKAEIPLKGRVSCNCMVMGVTSNDWSLGLQDEVKEVGAAYRRFQIYLEFNLKPEYVLKNDDGSYSTMMNKIKVSHDYPDNRFPDIFTITLYKAALQPIGIQKFKTDFAYKKAVHQCDLYKFEVLKQGGIELKNLSLSDALAYMVLDSKVWFEKQRQMMRLRETPIQYCQECGMPAEICRCGLSVVPNSGGEPIYVDPPPMPVYNEPRPVGLISFNQCPQCISDPFLQGPRTICKKCLAVTKVTCLLHIDCAREYMRNEAKYLMIEPTMCLLCKNSKLKPESTFDVYNYIHERDFTRKVEHNFREILTTFVVNGKAEVAGVFGNFDSIVSSEIIDFMEFGLNSLLSWAFKNELFDLADWLPAEFEGTPIGFYYHARFGKAGFHAKLQQGLDVCAALGLSVLTIFRNYVMLYPITSTFVLLGSLIAKYSSYHYNCARVDDAISLVRKNHTRLRGVLSNKAPLRVYACFSCLAGLSVFFTKYGLSLSCLCLFSMYFNYEVSRKDRLLTMAKTISDGRISRDQNWKGDVFKVLIGSTLIKKTLEAFHVAVNTLWFNVGISPQGGVCSVDDFNALSAGDKFWFKRGWENTNLDPIPSDRLCQAKDICAAVEHNAVFVRNETAGTVCGGVYLKSKLLLLPKHFITKERARYKIIRKPGLDGATTNPSTRFSMKAKDFRQVSADLVVADITNSTEHTDITGFFPNSLNRLPKIGLFLRRNGKGLVETFGVSDIAGPTTVTNNFKDDGKLACFLGMTYITNGLGPGTCMAMILSSENPSCILGFHLGAWSSSITGVGCIATHDDVLRYCGAYDDSISYSSACSMGNLPTQMFNTNTIIQGLHPNSVMAQFGEPGEYKVFGSVSTISKDSHDILETPIAGLVRSNMSCPISWGPPLLKHPQLGRKEKWFAYLRKATNTSEMIDRDLLDKAVADYVGPLLNIAHTAALKRRLTHREVINGIPGSNFIEGMSMTTAVGFPLNGTKAKYFDLAVDPVTNDSYYVFNTQIFIDMANKYISNYKRGVRNYPVFKTFPKIEPTLTTKEKVRLVNAAPISYQMVAREYLLPLYAFLSANMFLSECAVGINPESLQWEAVYNHITKYGRNAIALDYKSYDMTMPAQVTFAVSKILQLIAGSWGWSTEDIKVIIGLNTDIAWPVVCLNGDIVMLFGSTVSGHNGTVYFNSVANSILLRVAFYSIYDSGYVTGWFSKTNRMFREVTSTLTYGDDLVIGCNIPKYNAITVMKALGLYGFIMTDSHKSLNVAKYEDVRDIEFLKRKFIYKSEFGHIVANLNEDSIFKRLCCVHRPTSPNNMALLLATNIDSALHEWFYYGSDTYELRRKQLQQICEDLEPTTKILCKTALAKDFMSRMDHWRCKYITVGNA